MARQGKQPEPAQHSTAQHSTAQHSTAQHSIAQQLTSGLSQVSLSLLSCEMGMKACRLWHLQIRPPWFTSSTVAVKVSLSCRTEKEWR